MAHISYHQLRLKVRVISMIHVKADSVGLYWRLTAVPHVFIEEMQLDPNLFFQMSEVSLPAPESHK